MGYGYGELLWFDDMPSNPSDSNESLLSFVQGDYDSNDSGDFGDWCYLNTKLIKIIYKYVNRKIKCKILIIFDDKVKLPIMVKKYYLFLFTIY